MVELRDVSEMLSNSKEDSRRTLLIIDEFGRGTSTLDGYEISSLILVLRWLLQS